MQANLLQIGYVCRAHGLRGELRIKVHDVNSQALTGLKHIWIGPADVVQGGTFPSPLSRQSRLSLPPPRVSRAMEQAVAVAQQWQIGAIRSLRDGFYLLSVVGVSDRTAAERLAACRVYASRSELPPLAAEEVYLADLIGCEVVLAAGTTVGTVEDVQDAGGNQLLVVKRPGRAEALIPAVPEIVVNIDLDARCIAIDPPEGLLDLDLGGP